MYSLEKIIPIDWRVCLHFHAATGTQGCHNHEELIIYFFLCIIALNHQMPASSFSKNLDTHGQDTASSFRNTDKHPSICKLKKLYSLKYLTYIF